MDKIRIGVIGLGFGRHHVRTLANMEEAELVAVADHNPEACGGLDAFAAKYGARAYRDGETMLAGETLDAVSICTAPRARAALIEAAARRGLPMLIEKPWATDLAHAQALAQLCRDLDATVMTAFSFRFHPAIAKLRALLDGELGAPWLLSGQYVFGWVPPSSNWLWDPENGNGFFNENSCHLFDAVCSLLGEPEWLSAEAISPLDRPTEQAAALTVRFAGGAVAALTIGCVGAGAFHSYPFVELYAAHGQARLVGRDHVWEQLRWATRDDAAVHELVLAPEALGDTRYTDAMRVFLDCVRTGETPPVGVDAGVKTVAMAMATYESARTGARVRLRW